MKGKVIFIDELPVVPNTAGGAFLDKIKFLRNLCRAVKLPCIVSGTNSEVSKLIGRWNSIYVSRPGEDLKPWVQVMVKTPNASLHSFCGLVQIDNRGTLRDYLRGNDLDYGRIFVDFYGQNGNLAKFEPVKRLIRFLINQSSTSLPGLIPMILYHLFRLLPIHKDEPSKIWSELIDKASTQLKKRKI